ncbi:hypothetical protein EVJ30_08275 [Exiguobacterium sp. SH5S13]|uniref:hypothetical protein n=1 Tax=unclassified Exiguobacterium TaxID=2644629 RepID=UPI00104050E3|nr:MULTISPECIES: hypothetical protein [unclassified Exiguobacterium]TCI24329.1 hypothetical protein EVJ32_14570 [Exiguobacterium sp. SH5S4]TCI53431.1 hypothetical protein EVJ30_08275 [Exiguobacterium sp. SH5S13]
MNHHKPMTIEEVVAENIKVYIQAIDKTNKWVYERAGMSKQTFYNLLAGKGEITRNVEKLNRLFRIQDPMYFYRTDFTPPLSVAEIEKTMNLQQMAAANYHVGSIGSEAEQLNHTFKTLDEVIDLLDTLHTVAEVNQL